MAKLLNCYIVFGGRACHPDENQDLSQEARKLKSASWRI